jgi:hypothetical protein
MPKIRPTDAKPPTNPIAFLLNRGTPDAAVNAPAYSITKVLATGAAVLTPLASLIASWLGKVEFSAGDIVALTIALLGCLSILGAADVIARSLVAARAAATPPSPAPVAVAQRHGGVLFEFLPIRRGILAAYGPGPEVHIVAAREGQLLVAQPGEGVSWVDQDKVTFVDHVYGSGRRGRLAVR